jgi:hypothetical protein
LFIFEFSSYFKKERWSKGGLLLKKRVLFIVFIAAAGFLFAQTADDMERILNTREITYTQAASFVLTAANTSPAGGDAFTTARENRWLPAKAEADSPIRLGELSLLIMKSFGMKGGIFYSLFPLPRYACRELVYLRIIQGRTDPGGLLDGRTFLQILGRALGRAESHE